MCGEVVWFEYMEFFFVDIDGGGVDIFVKEGFWKWVVEVVVVVWLWLFGCVEIMKWEELCDYDEEEFVCYY